MSVLSPQDAARMATSVGLRPERSPLLDLRFDPFRCVYLLSILYCVFYNMTRWMYVISLCFRSTPVEVLHTVLLGPYKYLTGTVMAKLSTEQKRVVQTRLCCADYSGIEGRMSSNITRYSQSFVGRDFKVWAQLAPFILAPYLTSEQLKLWLSLSKVNHCCTHPVSFTKLM